MAEVSSLHLYRMIQRQKGSLLRRFFHASFSIALRVFFRRIETAGEERAPQTGPVVFVMNHPNGILDPALVFCALPRRISFLAKSTLFDVPGIGLLLRTVDALPLYRQVDKADRKLNQRTFTACFERLREGRCIALFPEGMSVPVTQMMPVKTGAARIALGAISLQDEAGAALKLPEPLRIQPVGLYYSSLTKMRGEVLLRFGEPFEVAPAALNEKGEPPREAVKELTARIEKALREVTLNVETPDELEEVRHAENLFSSLYETINVRESLTESFRRLRNLAAGLKFYGQRAPDEVAALRARVREYEKELTTLGLTPQTLAVSEHSRWYVWWHVVARASFLLALTPVALVGAVIHYPAHRLCVWAGRRFSKHDVDESVSTVQMLSAMFYMPLTWVIVAGLCYWRWGWRVGLLALPATILAGYVALKTIEGWADLRGWVKAAWLLVRRRGLFLRLLLERKALHHELERLGADMEKEAGAN
jgi:1-acyl-sn-glycerol-3-phosphate acyltransferase